MANLQPQVSQGVPPICCLELIPRHYPLHLYQRAGPPTIVFDVSDCSSNPGSTMLSKKRRVVSTPALSHSSASDRDGGADYAIVISTATFQEWPEVVAALKTKHGAASSSVLLFSGFATMKDELLLPLRELAPRHVAFVPHWSESTEAFVRIVHQLSRELNPSHPFSDCMWGIITGTSYESYTCAAWVSLHEPVGVFLPRICSKTLIDAVAVVSC